MEKRILIEKVESSPLSYSSESTDSRFLGVLEGIAADSTEKTRNGRRYPIELWRNVESSPDFKEAMETQTCFGECDHPFDDRVDTSIKEVAIVLLSFDIKNDGKVYCKFGILDTPNGRILKSLLDAGCQIGVSSRGVGEEIVRDGETIIDPDTYTFFGFDAVVMPAVISARPNVVESARPNTKSLAESFNREVESASSRQELESMKRIAEKINLPDLDSLVESIDIKLGVLNEGDNISSKLESELGNLAKENEELKSTIENLESQLSAKDIRLGECKKVIRGMRENSRNLRRVFVESKQRENRLSAVISEKDNRINRLIESSRRLKAEKSNLVRSIDKKDASMKRMTESANGLKSKLAGLVETNQKNEKSVRRMTESISELENQRDELKESSLSEIGELRNRISELESENDRTRRMYESVKSKMRDRDSDIEDLREENEGLRTALDEKDSEIRTLNSTVSSLKESSSRNADSSKKLVESKDSEISSMRSAIATSNKKLSETLRKYLSMKCSQNNLDENVVRTNLPKNCTTDDIDRVVTEFANRRDRLNKVPVSVSPRRAVISESTMHDSITSPEASQTMTILNGMQ